LAETKQKLPSSLFIFSKDIFPGSGSIKGERPPRSERERLKHLGSPPLPYSLSRHIYISSPEFSRQNLSPGGRGGVERGTLISAIRGKSALLSWNLAQRLCHPRPPPPHTLDENTSHLTRVLWIFGPFVLYILYFMYKYIPWNKCLFTSSVIYLNRDCPNWGHFWSSKLSGILYRLLISWQNIQLIGEPNMYIK
jgi:hypothetical protein